MTLRDETLLRRLETLERRNKHMQYGLLAVTLLLAFAWFTRPHTGQFAHAQETKTVVKAGEFQVVDGQKRVRMILGYNKKMTGLRLIDERGKTRAKLVLNDNKPGFSIVDTEGRPQLT